METGDLGSWRWFLGMTSEVISPMGSYSGPAGVGVGAMLETQYFSGFGTPFSSHVDPQPSFFVLGHQCEA